MEDKFETVVSTLRVVEKKKIANIVKNFQENENLQRRRS